MGAALRKAWGYIVAVALAVGSVALFVMGRKSVTNKQDRANLQARRDIDRIESDIENDDDARLTDRISRKP